LKRGKGQKRALPPRQADRQPWGKPEGDSQKSERVQEREKEKCLQVRPNGNKSVLGSQQRGFKWEHATVKGEYWKHFRKIKKNVRETKKKPVNGGPKIWRNRPTGQVSLKTQPREKRGATEHTRNIEGRLGKKMPGQTQTASEERTILRLDCQQTVN